MNATKLIPRVNLCQCHFLLRASSVPSFANSEPQIYCFVFFPMFFFRASQCLKEENQMPANRDTDQEGCGMQTPNHHSFICEPKINTAKTVSRIHLGPPASRSGEAKISPCRGSQLSLLPKHKNLACRDIFLLYSWCLLGSFCSPRHSWGKSHISSDCSVTK